MEIKNYISSLEIQDKKEDLKIMLYYYRQQKRILSFYSQNNSYSNYLLKCMRNIIHDLKDYIIEKELNNTMCLTEGE